MHTHHGQHRYIHAMGHAALTPFYDPFIRVAMRERAFKRRVVERLGVDEGRLLDVGCGTGTLAVWIAEAHPRLEVTGIDGDPEVLARARRKAAQAGVRVTFETALAGALPFADRSFARVTSTLMAHHLTSADKAAMFAEIRRVLAPGGELLLVDVGPAKSALGRALQRLLPRRVLSDNVEGRLPDLMRAAGLVEVGEVDRVPTLIGPFVFWRAVAPVE